MENIKKSNKRYVGKFKGYNTKFGPAYNILIDLNTDNNGVPTQYYKGSLIWTDAVTGKNYQVKQLSLWTPKEGIPQVLAEKGITHYVTLDLENDYQVTVLG